MKSCSLCLGDLPRYHVVAENESFCCPGCHAVHQILLQKGELEGASAHPLFRGAVEAGLISNPQLLEEIKASRVEVDQQDLRKYYFEVGDLWCPSCSEVIKWALLRLKGIVSCVVDYSTDLACVEYSPRFADKVEIEACVEALGYSVHPLDKEAGPSVSRPLMLRFFVSAFCALNIMMFSYPLYASYFSDDPVGYSVLFSKLSFIASLPVVTYCFWPILRRFFNSIRAGVWGMEALVTVGVSSAFFLSVREITKGGVHVYFDSMTVIVALILLGKIIEGRAKFSAKEALFKLMRAAPRRGRKQFEGGVQRFVPLKEISVGDRIVVFAGEKIVADGAVVEGEGGCDESMITGEAMPAFKQKCDLVIAGTLLQSGSLVIDVSATAENSTLQKILNIVEGDLSHKSAYVRAADAISKWFVPTVLAAAAIVALLCWVSGISDPGKSAFETGLLRAVAMLLISCPCAIGVAAPLAESYSLNAMAMEGGLVRNRGCLPFLGREDVFIFDKTGTLTEGKFHLKKEGFMKLSPYTLAILKGLARQSVHPIAVAIASAIDEKAEEGIAVTEYPGKGLKGEREGDLFILGSRSYLKEFQVPLPPPLSGSSDTIVYFAKNGVLVAILELGDRLKAEAPGLVASVAPAKSMLLSGDSNDAVEAVAKAAGIEWWKGECHPIQKRAEIEQLKSQGKVVAMVGDGINDAPALTVADIGISVISATDISVQVSDILLTTEKLSSLTNLIALARKGRRVVKQNLFWAFFYNTMGVPLAAFGLLTPLFSATAMVASSLIVLLNARRAASFKNVL